MQACLSASKEGESIFHHCGGPVKVVQTSLCTGNTLQCRFNRSVRAVKDVQACLSASKDRGSSFGHYGCPVKLVQSWF